MTNKKRWWFELESGSAYLFNESGRMLVRGDARSKSRYPAVTKVQELTDEEITGLTANMGKPVRVICGQRKIIQDVSNFDHTRSDFSRQFKHLNAFDFIGKVNAQLVILVENAPGPSGLSTVFDFVEDDEESTERSRDGSRVSSPEINTTLPAVRSEKKEDQTTEGKIKSAVSARVIGTVSVNINRLQDGSEHLRDISEAFVKKLKKSMKENPFFKGAPLVAVASVKKEEFNKNTPNMYKYKVIGGCHQLAAARQLSADYPQVREYKTRDVQVYCNSLHTVDMAVSWLAKRHNDVQQCKHAITMQDKVKYCRKVRKAYKEENPDGADKVWQDKCRDVVHLKDRNESSVVLGLASLQEEVFQKLLTMFTMYDDGTIKGVRLSLAELETGANIPEYHFRSFIQLKDPKCQMVLLRDLCEGEQVMKEFSSECDAIRKRHPPQQQFMKDTSCKTWEEARLAYPLYTTAEALDRFSGVNFGKKQLPDQWKEFIAAAKKSKKDDSELPKQVYKQDKCVTYISDTKITNIYGEAAKKLFANCSGVDLVICDVSKEKDPPKQTKAFLDSMTAVNLELDRNSLLMVVVTEVEVVGSVLDAIKEDCTTTEVVYLNKAPGKVKGGTGLLPQSIMPAVVAYWSANKTMPSPVTTMVTRNKDGTNLLEGKNWVDIYKEVIEAFSWENQWIVAINTPNGAAPAVASLAKKRNCIQLVKDGADSKRVCEELNKGPAKKRHKTGDTSAASQDPGSPDGSATPAESQAAAAAAASTSAVTPMDIPPATALAITSDKNISMTSVVKPTQSAGSNDSVNSCSEESGSETQFSGDSNKGEAESRLDGDDDEDDGGDDDDDSDDDERMDP